MSKFILSSLEAVSNDWFNFLWMFYCGSDSRWPQVLICLLTVLVNCLTLNEVVSKLSTVECSTHLTTCWRRLLDAAQYQTLSKKKRSLLAWVLPCCEVPNKDIISKFGKNGMSGSMKIWHLLVNWTKCRLEATGIPSLTLWSLHQLNCQTASCLHQSWRGTDRRWP